MKKVTRKKIVCLITVFLFLTSVLCACSAQQVGIKKQNSTTTTRHGSTSGTGLQGAGNATNDETEASGGEYTDITTPETDDTIDASIATGSSEYTENVGDFSTNVDGAIADTTQSTSSRQSTNVNSTTTSKENAYAGV